MANSVHRALLAALLALIWRQALAEDEGASDTAEEPPLDIDAFDEDGDGQVTVSEVLTNLLDFSVEGTGETAEHAKEKAFLTKNLPLIFKQIDDGDEIVSADELHTMLEQLAEHYVQSEKSDL
eukprot:TRINITY_DN2974_c0_g1_i1.p1 TRINITY_DN2974_c0_g1~~TRINITY_DN2974_c0_g1_i1.p1  ORF type:complete len:123 (-),score=30.61 TRINITY_DN2974_c0_g1_i1:74-442(-)